MDNYKLYHILSSAKDLVASYPQGQAVQERCERVLGKFDSKRYRVAVIGEFKRGKSSLINALMGIQILPTDILPATAVTNRIVYDTTQKIVITYKDGKSEETNIEELKNYATKLDAQKEKLAESIREIVVHYPSVFGQNDIEIIDTPGLNDNESMTQTIFDIIDKVDTAIVAISAMMPLSFTEQNLICDLIEQKNIYHLNFVVTFIDRVSDEVDEQDRIIAFIEKRLRDEILPIFRGRHGDNEALMKKAETILRSPKVMAVSSKLAMDGFIKNDNELIEKSRFPKFKHQIMAQLIANRDLDVVDESADVISELKESLAVWKNETDTECDSAIAKGQKELSEIAEARRICGEALVESFRNLGSALLKIGYNPDSRESFLGKFVNCREVYAPILSGIKKSNYTVETVITAVETGNKKCNDEFREARQMLKEKARKEMEVIETMISEAAKCCKIGCSMGNWEEIDKFPDFTMNTKKIDDSIRNILGDVFPEIQMAYNRHFADCDEELRNYFLRWKSWILTNAKRVREVLPEKERVQMLLVEEKQTKKHAFAQKAEADIKKASILQSEFEGINKE
ncbi:MAG: hypothetical protein E7473_11970 [Ruminococcaceae bacterium]|nr:hypothetical protein [Oscillospiraceae bacterium]